MTTTKTSPAVVNRELVAVVASLRESLRRLDRFLDRYGEEDMPDDVPFEALVGVAWPLRVVCDTVGDAVG